MQGKAGIARLARRQGKTGNGGKAGRAKEGCRSPGHGKAGRLSRRARPTSRHCFPRLFCLLDCLLFPVLLSASPCLCCTASLLPCLPPCFAVFACSDLLSCLPGFPIPPACTLRPACLSCNAVLPSKPYRILSPFHCLPACFALFAYMPCRFCQPIIPACVPPLSYLSAYPCLALLACLPICPFCLPALHCMPNFPSVPNFVTSDRLNLHFCFSLPTYVPCLLPCSASLLLFPSG